MTAHPTDPRRILMVRGGDHRWVRHDRALLRALQLGGHTVVDLDLGRHPTAVPTPFTEPEPTRPVDLRALDRLVDRARPDLVLFAGEALRPDPATAADLRARGARLLGVARLPEDATDERAAEVDGLLDLVGSSTAVTRPPGGPVTYGDRIAETLDALPAPRSPRTPPRVVLVSGYYGAGNRGDELLLATLARTLEEGLEDVQVVVAANDPAAVERVHGLPAFARADLTAAEEHAARATAVVLGPGGHWHDYSIAAAGGLAGAFRGTRVSPAHMAQLPLLVAGYGGRVIVHGMGVGPLEDPAARAAVRLTGRVSHAVSVRDEASRALLEPLAADWPAPVTVAPDVVYGLDLPECAPAGAEDEGWIAVSLRPWGDDADRRRELLREVVAAAAGRGLRIVGIPMQPTDTAPLDELGAVAEAEGVPVTILAADAPDDDVLRALGGARAAVTMRLHAALLRHRTRGTAVGLAYDPKVLAHFAELGRAEDALPLEVDPALFRARLEAALDSVRLPATAALAVAEREAAARRDTQRLVEMLRQAPVTLPDPAWVRYTPRR